MSLKWSAEIYTDFRINLKGMSHKNYETMQYVINSANTIYTFFQALGLELLNLALSASQSVIFLAKCLG